MFSGDGGRQESARRPTSAWLEVATATTATKQSACSVTMTVMFQACPQSFGIMTSPSQQQHPSNFYVVERTTLLMLTTHPTHDPLSQMRHTLVVKDGILPNRFLNSIFNGFFVLLVSLFSRCPLSLPAPQMLPEAVRLSPRSSNAPRVLFAGASCLGPARLKLLARSAAAELRHNKQ